MSVILRTFDFQNFLTLTKKQGEHMSTCKLCGQDRVLKNSHIIPKLFMKKTKVNGKNCKLSNNEPPNLKNQEDPKEPALCEECEGKLNRYETYYSNFFYNDQAEIKVEIKPSEDELSSQILNYDYAKIKYFILSLLWRLSITSLSEFKIYLSPETQEDLRQIIYNEVETQSSEYPFLTCLVCLNDENASDNGIVIPPIVNNFPPKSITLYIGGIMYFISTIKNNHALEPHSMTKNHWTVSVKHINDIPILLEQIDKCDFCE